jgi:hypothetical protein
MAKPEDCTCGVFPHSDDCVLYPLNPIAERMQAMVDNDNNVGTAAPIREWLNLPDEEQLKQNSAYKAQYDWAVRYHDVQNVPAWEDLTHQQRDNVRQECIRYARELDDFVSREFGEQEEKT